MIPFASEAGALLEELKSRGLRMPAGWTFEPINNAKVIEGPGVLLFQWCEPGPGIAPVGDFTYWDEDIRSSVTLALDGDQKLCELEIWRGDGNPIKKFPTANDLKLE
jgi:hypothetical protein